MTVLRTMFLGVLSGLVALAGCGDSGGGGGKDAIASPDARADGAVDVGKELPEPEEVVVEVEEGTDVAPEVQSQFLQALPFVLNRTDVGEPLTEEEIAEFTKKITTFYKESGFFDWLWWTCHGMDASYDPGMPDYKLFWQDTGSVKEGDTLRFVHHGGADNLTLRTTKILNNAIAAYLASGDMKFGRLVEQYSKGLVALSLALEWGEDDPVKYLQARAVFALDHEYTMEGGRKVKLEYGPVKKHKYDWNAHTIPNVENPYWGEIWVRTMRSKDDVPHMYRSVPLLRRVAVEGADESVREAAALAVEYMEGFAKDIVDNGYQIRTKDEDGNAFVPLNENGTVNDLASFVLYEDAIPGAECTAKLGSAFIGYGETKDNDCGLADHNFYEDVATEGHYFNHAIIRYFHIAAVSNALTAGEHDMARTLLIGLIERADRYAADQKGPVEHKEWHADLAGFLIASAATGFPLTSAEARLVAEQYGDSAEHYQGFAYWDPWDESVPDGEFNYKPPRSGPSEPEDPDSDPHDHVRLPEMTFALEYCWSPFRNPKGALLLDCDIVLDPSRWGE